MIISNGKVTILMSSFGTLAQKRDLDKTRIKHASNAVIDVMELVNMTINLFDNDYESLVHLTGGSVASDDVESDMNKMYEQGEAAAVRYMIKNIRSEKPDIYNATEEDEFTNIFIYE